MKNPAVNSLWGISLCILAAAVFLKLTSDASMPLPSNGAPVYERIILNEISDRSSLSGLDIKRVYYTQDQAIRGLQVPVPGCDDYLQIAIITRSDEWLAMLQRRAQDGEFEVHYRHKGMLHREFPAFAFWRARFSTSLTHKMLGTGAYTVDPVFVFLYPKRCGELVARLW